MKEDEKKMYIKNDKIFANFTEDIKNSFLKKEEMYNNPEFDIMDYFWFLNSLLEVVDNNYVIEILDDEDGKTYRYKVIDIQIDNSKTNHITFNLVNLTTTHSEVRKFVVKQVKDARSPLSSGAYKYYITTQESMHRFMMFFR